MLDAFLQQGLDRIVERHHRVVDSDNKGVMYFKLSKGRFRNPCVVYRFKWGFGSIIEMDGDDGEHGVDL